MRQNRSQGYSTMNIACGPTVTARPRRRRPKNTRRGVRENFAYRDRSSGRERCRTNDNCSFVLTGPALRRCVDSRSLIGIPRTAPPLVQPAAGRRSSHLRGNTLVCPYDVLVSELYPVRGRHLNRAVRAVAGVSLILRCCHGRRGLHGPAPAGWNGIVVREAVGAWCGPAHAPDQRKRKALRPDEGLAKQRVV